jgi:2-polyprenyl-3-methyl-5-hydroxy-6-metoxy-1,4-benzoquinol methylase
MSFTARFEVNSQEIVLAGTIRPRAEDELAEVGAVFRQAIESAQGKLYLNAKRLVHINNFGFQAIARFVRQASEARPSATITIVTSSYVGWHERRFSLLLQIGPNIVVQPYDKHFYPGQAVLEDAGFIPILRAQTRMTWRHERNILPRHGLRRGMSVADICCGIGDFAVLVQREFRPCRLLAIDHAPQSLKYATRVADQSGIDGIEYCQGDAANLLVEDDQFDFVTCRHSLQVFDRPELILSELFRICKPGGRVYITNEKNSHPVDLQRGGEAVGALQDGQRTRAEKPALPARRRFRGREGRKLHGHQPRQRSAGFRGRDRRPGKRLRRADGG